MGHPAHPALPPDLPTSCVLWLWVLRSYIAFVPRRVLPQLSQLRQNPEASCEELEVPQGNLRSPDRRPATLADGDSCCLAGLAGWLQLPLLLLLPRVFMLALNFTQGVVSFLDIAGFTKLTERLAEQPDGAERLAKIINKLLTQLLNTLTTGDVIKSAPLQPSPTPLHLSLPLPLLPRRSLLGPELCPLQSSPFTGWTTVAQCDHRFSGDAILVLYEPEESEAAAGLAAGAAAAEDEVVNALIDDEELEQSLHSRAMRRAAYRAVRGRPQPCPPVLSLPCPGLLCPALPACSAPAPASVLPPHPSGQRGPDSPERPVPRQARGARPAVRRGGWTGGGHRAQAPRCHLRRWVCVRIGGRTWRSDSPCPPSPRGPLPPAAAPAGHLQMMHVGGLFGRWEVSCSRLPHCQRRSW